MSYLLKRTISEVIEELGKHQKLFRIKNSSVVIELETPGMNKERRYKLVAQIFSSDQNYDSNNRPENARVIKLKLSQCKFDRSNIGTTKQRELFEKAVLKLTA